MDDKKFVKRDTRRVSPTFLKKKVEDIIFSSEGYFEIQGRINRVILTAGPTVFVVSDGTGSLQLKGFIGAGARAYPEIVEGDCIKSR